MASPIGHILVGQVAYRAGSAATGARGAGLAWLCAFAAVAPDLDFLPGAVLGHPALYHQGVSHSFVAAAGFTLALAFAHVRRWRGLAAAWLPIMLAYASHLVVDLFGPDRRPPYGIPLFWPVTDAAFLSPITILPGFHHANSTGANVRQWLAGVSEVKNLLAIGTELAIFGPLVVLAEVWNGRRGRTRTASGGEPPSESVRSQTRTPLPFNGASATRTICVMGRALDQMDGLGVYSSALLQHVLQRDSQTRYVILLRTDKNASLFSGFANAEVSVIPSRSKVWWDQVLVPLAARRASADIIFNPKFSVPLISRRPSVFVLHGSDWYVNPGNYKWWDNVYIRLFLPAYHRKARRLLCISRPA